MASIWVHRLILLSVWQAASGQQEATSTVGSSVFQLQKEVQERQGGRAMEARKKEREGYFPESPPVGVKEKQGPYCSDKEVNDTLPFCIGDDYEKHIRPDEKQATRVYVQLKITEIEKVDDANLTMTLHMEFEVRWMDPRVTITSNLDVWNPADPMQEWRTIDQELVDEFLWIPDVAVYNLKEFQMSWVIQPMATVNLFPNASIYYNFACRVTVGCNFFFENFPLDQQECEFYVGSYGHTKEEIALDGTYILQHTNRQRPLQYKLDISDLDEIKKTYQSKNQEGAVLEEYSVAGFKVDMVRGYSVYLSRTYFPAALMVVVSFISYLIGQEEVVGRLALLVTLTLIEINILNQAGNYKVPARSTTALELYVLVCLMFVSAGLFEYALVLYRDSPIEKKRRSCMRKIRGKPPPPTKEEQEEEAREKENAKADARESKRMNEEAKGSESEHTPNESRSDESQVKGKDEDGKEKGGGAAAEKESSSSDNTIENRMKKACDTKNIDIVSGVLFPCLFLIFNIVYWVYYLT